MTLPPSSLWPKIALAAAIGILSGIAARRFGMPLPWMLGPMIGCSLAAVAGAPLHGPAGLRQVVIPVIGVMLGSGFHPGLFANIGEWIGTLLLLPAFLATATVASYTFYRRVGGYSPVNAFFCAAPGGINEMVVLGAEAGGDERRIALAHALRIFLSISIIALVFALLLDIRAARGPGSWVGLTDLSLRDAALLVAGGVAGLLLGRRLRLPAPMLFGPMLASAATHMTGIVTAAPPSLFVVAAQITIGTILGCRFAGISVTEMRRDMALGFGSALVLLAVTTGFAALLLPLTGTPLAQAVLAYSPAGLTEMSLLSLAMGQDVAYVSTMHVARIAMILFGMTLVFRAIGTRLIAASRPDSSDPSA
ncbi:AbrB family transcriptional regulator [Tropicimonas sp. IMCC6043]|uniref:AbrB family transcriptional regulator n=1 Tax=Tropicimonas sp. IMCC6043 TaxID=2510645 RepID=UPI00101CDCCA|nr:AbrB family transcriptional regulator [Tropicimonas sp. IMCC6043]RYH12170.1 AbrB family transcriptional regulator [Tropicimonas sp. IMCC6043]